jgi:hypothetical protein
MIWTYVREEKPRATNRRRHRRHPGRSLRAEIDRKAASIADISARGLRLSGAPGWVVPGQGLALSLIFQTMTKEVRIPVFGRVLRREDTGTILVYAPPIDSWPDSLETLLRAGMPLRY